MTALAPVVVVRVKSQDGARNSIATATADCQPGRQVRLEVGSLMPPLWLSEVLRVDLKYQVVATTETAAVAWSVALLGGAE